MWQQKKFQVKDGEQACGSKGAIIMDVIDEYMPLTSQTLAVRLCHRPELREHLGPDHESWQVNEVGDGNLNLVFLECQFE